MFALVACSNQENELQTEKASEPIALVKDFDAFNATLATQLGASRQYDVATNEIDLPVTRARNWRKIWRADAKGAFYGGIASILSGFIGCLMGALLTGVASSAVEFAFQTNPVAPPQTQLYAMIESEEIFDAESLYELGTGIELRYYLDENSGYDMGEVTDSIELAVGIAHNIFMDALLAPASSGGGLDDGGGSDDGGLDEGPSGVYELFGEDCSAEYVCSTVFQEQFSDFLMDIVQAYDEEALDEEGTESDTVMNLFMEAVALCDGDFEDIDAVVRYYQHNIQQSNELTADEKQAVYFGMVVAVYSIEYWQNRFPDDNTGTDVESGEATEP